MAIILFVTIVALSTTLITGKVMAESCPGCGNLTMPTNANMTAQPANTTSLDSQLSQAVNKQCQGLQATVPVLGDAGVDAKTLGDLQNLINKAC